MTNNRRKQPTASVRWYRGADVPLRVIRRFARQVAERFQPEKIGSSRFRVGDFHSFGSMQVRIFSRR